jgi:hypothetical protein
MDNLNKTVTIDLYDSIYFNTKKIAFKKFRGKYNYISIVYLETGYNTPHILDTKLS